jgi:hypothetical protein
MGELLLWSVTNSRVSVSENAAAAAATIAAAAATTTAAKEAEG